MCQLYIHSFHMNKDKCFNSLILEMIFFLYTCHRKSRDITREKLINIDIFYRMEVESFEYCSKNIHAYIRARIDYV